MLPLTFSLPNDFVAPLSNKVKFGMSLGMGSGWDYIHVTHPVLML